MSINKRSWQDIENADIDRRPLIIPNDTLDSFAKPYILTPICLLSRSQLPLTYLDVTVLGSRLFTANVKILEACHEVRDERDVLVVQDATQGKLYVIERVQSRQYGLCKLSTWVQPHHVLRQQRAGCISWNEPPRKRRETLDTSQKIGWWSPFALEKPEENQSGNTNAAPRLCMRQDTFAPTTRNEIPPSSHAPEMEATGLLAGLEDSHAPDNSAALPLSSQELLAELSKQYLDALYLSRTSLAFFSKGPLSRARAAFSDGLNSELATTELVAFIRGTLLTSTIMDKKYREAIPEILQDIPADFPVKAKKKRKWRPKRDKLGLFSDERHYVIDWWHKCEEAGNQSSSSEPLDIVVTRRTSLLRNREAFLQVILVLEILALEKAAPKPQPDDLNVEPKEAKLGGTQVEPSERKPRKTKHVDVSDLLHQLLDRITIWHSLDTTSTSKPDQTGVGKEEVNDDLRNFCVEVVLPFYMSRIPEHVASVNKKLGGPDILTPVKRKHPLQSRKPGQPAVRQAPGKRARKPFERVATDPLNKPKQIPSLNRSATDTDAIAIKREASNPDVAMKSIPTIRPHARRVSAVHSISFGRREVDLSALHHANEEKMRKKAEIEEKLSEAIGAIKKPHRAIRDVAQQADESFAKAISKAKANGGRRPLDHKTDQTTSQSSHVKATPSHKRTQLLPTRADGFEDLSVVPSTATKLSSNHLVVPQTGHRYRLGSPSAVLESPSVVRTSSVSILQTPVKPTRLIPPTPPMLRASASEDNVIAAITGPRSIYDMWNDEEYEELA